MQTIAPIERTLTQTDHARLQGLLTRGAPPSAEAMQDMLDNSDLVPSPAVPPTVVTMYTRVLLQDLQEDTQSTLTLCYPQDADVGTGQVSVLSPVGAALLGLRAGEIASWRSPRGEERRARILSILYQPEAAGDFLR